MAKHNNPGHNHDPELKGDAYILKGRLDDIKREQAEQNERDSQYKADDIETKKRQVKLTEKLALLTFCLVVLGLLGTVVSTWQSVIAQRAAKAAEDAVTLGTQSAKIEQRAYLHINSFRLTKEPVIGDTTLTVAVNYLNGGRTGAHTAYDRTRVGFHEGEAPRPNWDLIERAHAFVVHPSIPTALHVNYKDLTTETIAAYRAQMTVLTIRVRIDYMDVFNDSHWVEACAFHRFGEPLTWFPYCRGDGNDFDRNPPQK